MDLSQAIQQGIARLLVETYINASQGKDHLQGGTHFFYPSDFGDIFKALGWDTGCCIEVEVRWTHREERNWWTMNKVEATLKAAARLMSPMSNKQKARLVCTLLEQLDADDDGLVAWIHHETGQRLHYGEWVRGWESEVEK
jgi:hypothetical protein